MLTKEGRMNGRSDREVLEAPHDVCRESLKITAYTHEKLAATV